MLFHGFGCAVPVLFQCTFRNLQMFLDGLLAALFGAFPAHDPHSLYLAVDQLIGFQKVYIGCGVNKHLMKKIIHVIVGIWQGSAL